MRSNNFIIIVSFILFATMACKLTSVSSGVAIVATDTPGIDFKATESSLQTAVAAQVTAQSQATSLAADVDATATAVALLAQATSTATSPKYAPRTTSRGRSACGSRRISSP